jgi:hypothetical protein
MPLSLFFTQRLQRDRILTTLSTVQGAYEPLLQQNPQQGSSLNVPTTSGGNGDEGSDGGLLMMISMDDLNCMV